MFVYFSKKIAASNQSKALCCFEWNQVNGWVACGGESSLLKVFKLVDDKSLSPTTSSLLSFDVSVPFRPAFHQTLEGHSGRVTCLAWNSIYDKLASSDQNGLIIVWALNNDDTKWYEEMINNGNKSLVSDMKWARDGKHICIAYENGTVIVGSVDGTRLWGNEFGGDVSSFRFIEWSPLGKSIIFITASSNEMKLLSNLGKDIKTISLMCHEIKEEEEASNKNIHVVSVHWHHDDKILAIAFSNGCIQLRCQLSDSSPTILNSNLHISCCRWNHNGTVLAVCGRQVASTSMTTAEEEKISNMVKFYSSKGIHLYTLTIPQQKTGSSGIDREVSSLSWERSGLRIAMVIGESIYFANLRPDYKYVLFPSTTLVLTDHMSNERDDDNQVSILFWKIKTNEKREKLINNIIVRSINAIGDICAIVLENNNGYYQSSTFAHTKFRVIFCDECGSTLKEKETIIEPVFTAISERFFILSDHQIIYFWKYNSSSKEVLEEKNSGEDDEWYFNISSKDIEEQPQKKLIKKCNVLPCLDGSSAILSDKINFLCITSNFFLVSQTSGVINLYTLPPTDILLLHTLKLSLPSQRPIFLEINCNNSKLAVIDSNNVLEIMDINLKKDMKLIGYGQQYQQQKQQKDYNKFQKKDVWKIIWSEDNPSSLAIIEKSNLLIIHDLEDVESYHFSDGDSIPFGGHILQYKDFKVLAATNLDEIISSSSSVISKKQNRSDYRNNKDSVVAITEFETRPIQDLRQILKKQGFEDAFSFLLRSEKKKPHQLQPWKYLAEAALENSNLNIAEKIYSHLKDIRGISFVKKLKEVFTSSHNIRQRAEIAVFLNRYEEAETIFREELGRNDLAMDLRSRLGDWSKVVDLAQTGGISGGNDSIIRQSWENIGDDYADKRYWSEASSAKCYPKIIDTYLCDKNIQALYKLATEELSKQEENSILLEKTTVGQAFESLGAYEHAIKSHVNEDDIQNAIEICIHLSKWDTAAVLLEENKNKVISSQSIESLLDAKIKDCLSRGNKFQALELYRIGKSKSSEASRMLLELAEDAIQNQKFVEAKNLFILYALEVDRQREESIAEFNLHAASRNKQQLPSNRKNNGFLAYETFETLMNTRITTAIATTSSNRRINKFQENAWNGASAYHYFLLSHIQFYNHEIDAAMKTAIKCLEYINDILNPHKEEVLSLVALTSFQNEYYHVCSRVLFQLETLQELQENKRSAYRKLAQTIFTNFPPIDRKPALEPFYNSLLDSNNNSREENPSFCIITGGLIPNNYDQDAVIQCKRCYHSMYKKELLTNSRNRGNCPLCRINVMIRD